MTHRVAVLGGGSFGTAIANTIATNGYKTQLWMRDQARASLCERERENAHYLPGYHFHENLTASSDLSRALTDCDTVFISVPSASFRDVAEQVKPFLAPNAHIISTTKGIESDSFLLMSQILEALLPKHSIGVLSGPNFAKEIIAKKVTGSVIASDSVDVVTRIQSLLSSSTWRIYDNHDRYGVELAGALKNIYAIITGMAAALDSGHNTIAMLMTRALAEMGRFSQAMGANPMTLLGLAGVGDLILTCSSDLSRNYRLGYALGSGQTVEQAKASIGQVVEGVNTLALVKTKAQALDVYMPLVSGLYALVFDGQPVDIVINKLMMADHNSDVEFISAS